MFRPWFEYKYLCNNCLKLFIFDGIISSLRVSLEYLKNDYRQAGINNLNISELLPMPKVPGHLEKMEADRRKF